ncbi:MAG TPA: glycoside hydrolase domain-containing protein, partial [Acidimicrobiales bacterium]|nr:glycoside hydrolase domain-containing protein [Acidimicrobiales bacterium]
MRPDGPPPAWPAGGGNHRLLVDVADGTRPVAVRFERRWVDPRPRGATGVLVTAGDTTVERWGVVDDIDREPEVTVVFEPVAGAGRYAVHVLPVDAAAPAHYPQDRHTELPNPDEKWLAAAAGAAAAVDPDRTTWEHRSPHHAWDEMELRATPVELAALDERWPPGQLAAFGEPASRPVRLRTGVPVGWLDRGPGDPVEVRVRPGSRAAFQVAVWAARGPLGELAVTFVADAGTRLRCFNPLPAGAVIPDGALHAVWCGVEVEPGAADRQRAEVHLTSNGGSAVVPVELIIDPQAPGPDAPGHRLWWLESDRAVGAGPTRAYRLVREGAEALHVVGRSLALGRLGLPQSIVSRFTPDGQSADGPPTELLAGPVTLRLFDADGVVLPWCDITRAPSHRDADGVSWTARAGAGPVTGTFDGRLDYDGTLTYQVELAASREVDLADVRLELPLRGDVTGYYTGLGVEGGRRAGPIDWTWDPAERNQDCLWIGVPHAGLQLSLRDDTYVRSLNTNFYKQRPLVAPRSWANDGRGRIQVRDETGGAITLVAATSGTQYLAAGDRLRFDFRLAITPFKPIDLPRHFGRRYLHGYVAPEEAAARGASAVTLHHATPPNPYLNYPLLAADALRGYVEEAHRRGLAVRIYDTIRELTTRAPEFWALLHFGDELFFPGPGGGPSWQQEHVEPPYLAGWYAKEVDDTTLVTTGAGRWDNFYVESLAWLGEATGFDGLYLDDVAFDRDTMKRVRHVLEATTADADIDLHSANQFNPRDGFASSANLYMELMPYLDRLWFGEGFDYAKPADYWLVEISGLPFGLTGEMLEGGGHPWRGMLYGMTNRLGWPDADPRPLWKLWDRLDMSKAVMQGYWLPDPLVVTGRDDVLATTFTLDGRALVAIGSWSDTDIDVDL